MTDSDPSSRDVAELLENVHRLRLTLAADLSAAASAMDADEPAIARDIIEADSGEVRRLAGPVPAELQPQPTRRRRRALLALPAIPLMGAFAMTGAAALAGGGSPAAPIARSAVRAPASQQTPRQISETAATTLQQLELVITRHPQPSRVVALAAHLHDQLTELIATSANNPARLGEVQRLLAVEQHLLERQSGEAAAIALAASRKVTRLLEISGLATTTRPAPSAPGDVATTTPTPKPARTKPPTTKPTSAKPQPSSSTPSAELPTAKPSPSRPAHHHHHHHHHHLPDPLLSQGPLDRNP